MAKLGYLTLPAMLFMSAALVGCASPDGQASLPAMPDPATTAQGDLLLQKRLANLPKVRPWPIDWFEPKETVAGADVPAAVPSPRAAPLISDEAWQEAQRFASESGTDALLVWYKGAPDRVWYRDGFDPQALTNTYYLNYFALVLAVGQALEEGAIASIDESVTQYIPEWQGTDREPITIRHLLQMRAGFELYYDNIDPADKATRVFFGSYSTAAALEYPAEDPAGEVFEYNYIVPEILGIVLERATGERYADFLSSRIWAPLGNSDAQVWLDREGGRPHFNAALFADADDWMRIGAMIAGEGAYDGRQIVPASWIATMAEPSPAKPNYGMTWLATPYEAERFLSPEVRYTVKADAPFAIADMLILDGYGGQRVYVSPSQDLAIVRIGAVQRENWDDSELPNIIAGGL